jgi:hypothetical protein
VKIRHLGEENAKNGAVCEQLHEIEGVITALILDF